VLDVPQAAEQGFLYTHRHEIALRSLRMRQILLLTSSKPHSDCGRGASGFLAALRIKGSFLRKWLSVSGERKGDLMKFLNPDAIVAGMISSILAVICVELYVRVGRQIHLRSLRRVLSLKGKPTLIVAPIKNQDLAFHSISYKDAYAFGHLFDLCTRVASDAELAPFHKLSEIGNERNFLSVGGPLSNGFTQDELEKFVPGFALIPQDKANDNKSSDLDGDGLHKYIKGFSIGDHKIVIGEHDEPALLIKLTPELLDQDRLVHLIFGYSGHGTAAAAYYLWRYYKLIHDKFGDGAYCLVIKAQKGNTYKNVTKSFQDFTEVAFKRPTIKGGQ